MPYKSHIPPSLIFPWWLQPLGIPSARTHLHEVREMTLEDKPTKDRVWLLNSELQQPSQWRLFTPCFVWTCWQIRTGSYVLGDGSEGHKLGGWAEWRVLRSRGRNRKSGRHSLKLSCRCANFRGLCLTAVVTSVYSPNGSNKLSLRKHILGPKTVQHLKH